MESQGAPWIEVPDNWLDSEYSNHSGYKAFQEYFDLKVKPEVINEYLMGEGVCPTAKIEIERFTAKEMLGNLVISGTMRVTGPLKQGGTGTDFIDMNRTLNKNDRKCKFELLGASRVKIDGFGVPYYRRVISLLRKLGIKKITTMPTTTSEHSLERNRFVGAYVWSFYGYSNDNMPETLNLYVGYLKQVRGIKLTPDHEKKIMSTRRMLYLAKDEQPNGEKTGKKFLQGMDAQEKPTRDIWWDGTHHNINDENSKEMTELIDYLLKKMK